MGTPMVGTKLAQLACVEKQRLIDQIRVVMTEVVMIETLELRSTVDSRVTEYLENRLRNVRERRDRLLNELKQHTGQHLC
jgi:hypothetical protein